MPKAAADQTKPRVVTRARRKRAAIAARATLTDVLSFLSRLRRRRPAKVVVDDSPLVSRAGLAARGMRPGDSRHRPTATEGDLAGRIGVDLYDSERGRF